MEDHPDIDRTEVPSRVDLTRLTPAQLEALSRGEAIEYEQSQLDAAVSGAVATGQGAGQPENFKIFKDVDNQLDLGDVVKLEAACLECGSPGEFQRAEMNLPRFGRAEIQSFTCSECAYTYRKVRSVAPIRYEGVVPLEPGYGRRIILDVQSESDLNREVLRSDGCTFRVPELDLEVSSRVGSMSTVEGCLHSVSMNLRFLRFTNDDSDDEDEGGAMSDKVDARVNQLLDGVRNGTRTFRLILEDEEDGSHIQTFEGDTRIFFEIYPIDGDSVDSASHTDQPPVLCGLNSIQPGVVLDAMYGDEWISGCKVMAINGEVIWVERIDDPGAGRWHVSVEEIRGCTDPTCGCQVLTLGNVDSGALQDATPDMELLDFLNKYADHVDAQEGAITNQQKQQQNAQAQIEQEIQTLEEMD
mmetsp:Transcript_2113/g.4851  ORF Transcript_2113/g.4851 Transcript_2113/m.4851 type:complete len:414 (+) Transcript_2113:190-1431(+)